ncbi:MAG: hypothetical protein ACK5OX_08620 [Desertimonas sp.]
MSDRTNNHTTNRIWAGIAAGILTTAALAAVGLGAYRAGQRDDTTIEVVRGSVDEGGARTVVVDGMWRDGWHGTHRGGPGFVLVALLVIGVIALVASRRGRRCEPWSGRPWMAEDHLDRWHRRAHGGDPALSTTTAGPTTATRVEPLESAAGDEAPSDPTG